jgi:hypothetical protein
MEGARLGMASLLCEQDRDTDSLFYYYEQPEIGLPLVGRDTSSRLVKSFNNELVGATSGRILGAGRIDTSIALPVVTRYMQTCLVQIVILTRDRMFGCSPSRIQTHRGAGRTTVMPNGQGGLKSCKFSSVRVGLDTSTFSFAWCPK